MESCPLVPAAAASSSSSAGAGAMRAAAGASTSSWFSVPSGTPAAAAAAGCATLSGSEFVVDRVRGAGVGVATGVCRNGKFVGLLTNKGGRGDTRFTEDAPAACEVVNSSTNGVESVKVAVHRNDGSVATTQGRLVSLGGVDLTIAGTFYPSFRTGCGGGRSQVTVTDADGASGPAKPVIAMSYRAQSGWA